MIATTSSQTSFPHYFTSGVISVDYETREGSGKMRKDFKHATGTLVSTCIRYNSEQNFWPTKMRKKP